MSEMLNVAAVPCGTVRAHPLQQDNWDFLFAMRDPIKICLGENEMAAVIDVFRVFEVSFRSGLLKAEVNVCHTHAQV